MHSTSIFRCIMTMIFNYTIFFIFQIFVFKFFSANIIKCFFFQMIPVALLLITFLKKILVLFIACSFKNHQNFFIQPLPLNTSCLFYILLFFCQGFLSQILTTFRTAGEGRGPFFIALYLFYPLMNIETLATSHVRWLSHIFNCTTFIYQAATRWDLPLYQITISLIDDVKILY